MATLKLPIVVVIAIVAALAGGAASYVFIPSTDPEVKALLQRQVELAEQEARQPPSGQRTFSTPIPTTTPPREASR